MKPVERCAALALLCAAIPTPGARAGDGVREILESHVARNQGAIVAELVRALSIPDVASDRANIRKKGELLVELFRKRKFEAGLWETAGNPLVYAERRSTAASRTLLIYAHYDGQPVDPPLWKQDSPFVPVLRDGRVDRGGRLLADPLTVRRFENDWRLYARSSSDDTSPIIALLAAVDALDAAGRGPRSNLRVLLDGEEEAGSPSLPAAIVAHRDALAADLMLVLDGPVHASEKPTIVYGARGILTLDITVFGPKSPLHSGHYGNWVPNPAMRLAQLLASMKDDRGRTTVKGFYDGIALSADERAVLAAVPDDEPTLKRLFGIADTDAVGASLQEALQYPSLNVRGLRSAYVGAEARTVVPESAVASIDIRLVKETPAEALYAKLLDHIRGQGFHVVTDPPDDATRAAHPRIARVVRVEGGSAAYRTDLSDPQADVLYQALSREMGEAPVRVRTSGGTVPIEPFVRTLSLPAVSLPIVNFDNNQHAENENLRLGHFFRGITILGTALSF